MWELTQYRLPEGESVSNEPGSPSPVMEIRDGWEPFGVVAGVLYLRRQKPDAVIDVPAPTPQRFCGTCSARVHGECRAHGVSVGARRPACDRYSEGEQGA